MIPPKIEEQTPLDSEQAFLLYATFAGDLERTAHACGVRAVDILKAAEDLGWQERLKPILELKQSARPGDFERAMNRALNFAQAFRYRMFLERVLKQITGMTPEEVNEYIFTRRLNPKDGLPLGQKILSTRALADLASALEKAHSLSYMALSDTAQDRAKRKEAEESGESASQMHTKIADAMSKLRSTKTVRGQLLDAQIEVAETERVRNVKPENPYDKD